MDIVDNINIGNYSNDDSRCKLKLPRNKQNSYDDIPYIFNDTSGNI